MQINNSDIKLEYFLPQKKISLSGTPISLPKIVDLPIWAQEKITCMMFNIFVKVLYCEKFIPLIFLQWTEANMNIQIQVLN